MPASQTRPRLDRPGILAVLVLVLAAQELTGVSVFHATLVAAALMGITRSHSAEEARRSVDWSTLIAIGAAMVVGRAVETSGLGSASAGAMIAYTRIGIPVDLLAMAVALCVTLLVLPFN